MLGFCAQDGVLPIADIVYVVGNSTTCSAVRVKFRRALKNRQFLVVEKCNIELSETESIAKAEDIGATQQAEVDRYCTSSNS